MIETLHPSTLTVTWTAQMGCLGADNFEYEAFGGALGAIQTTRMLFAGEFWDADLNSYFLRARFMSPENGRFNSLDSFEGSTLKVASLHKYAYADNSPVSFRDPSGHLTSLADVSIASAVQGIIRTQALVGLGFLGIGASGGGFSSMLPFAASAVWSMPAGNSGFAFGIEALWSFADQRADLYAFADYGMDISQRLHPGRNSSFDSVPEIVLYFGDSKRTGSLSTTAYFPINIARVGRSVLKSFAKNQRGINSVLDAMLSDRRFTSGSIGIGFDSNSNVFIALNRHTKIGTSARASFSLLDFGGDVLGVGESFAEGAQLAAASQVSRLQNYNSNEILTNPSQVFR